MPPDPPPPPSPPKTDVAWYQPDLHPAQLSPATTSLLSTYSHIPPPEIDAHVTAIRDKAWAIHPYPCIGQWRFLDLSIAQQPAYARVLALLKEGGGHDGGHDGGHEGNADGHDENERNDNGNGVGEQKKLLDLGCCFAQDIRRLIHDGAPPDALYACDLQPEFLELGYDLFKDRESCQAHFFTADVLRDDAADGAASGGGLAGLAGEIDVVYTASFFHLFSWDDQVRVAERIVRVLRPRGGSLVFGRQTGGVKAGEMERTVNPVPGAKPVWRHDVQSFRRLWEVVGGRTGSRWGVWAELYETGHTAGHWAGEGVRMLRFEVTRLE